MLMLVKPLDLSRSRKKATIVSTDEYQYMNCLTQVLVPLGCGEVSFKCLQEIVIAVYEGSIDFRYLRVTTDSTECALTGTRTTNLGGRSI
jgi:hypothetical protein